MMIFGNAYDQAGRGPYFKGTKSKILLIACVIAVALVDALPTKWVERAAMDLGEELCEAAAEGMRSTPARAVFIGPYFTGLLRDAGRHFKNDCDVELRVGRVRFESWGERRTDYVLLFRSNGRFIIGVTLRLASDWSLPLPVERGRYAGKFHVRPIWPPGL